MNRTGKSFRKKALGMGSSLLAAVMMCGVTVNASEIVAPDAEIALETEKTILTSEAHLEQEGEYIEGRDFGGGRVEVSARGITLQDCTGIAELLVFDGADNFRMYGGSVEGAIDEGIIRGGVTLYASGARISGTDIRANVTVYASDTEMVDCTGITQLTVESGADNFTMRQCIIDGSNEENSVLIQGNNATLDNNVINAGEIGLFIKNSSGHEITGNQILDAKGYAGFLLSSTGNNVVTDNTVSGSGHTGLMIELDTGSTIESNQISDSVTRPVENLPRWQWDYHGEGVIISRCNGTIFSSNHVIDTLSQSVGNGIGISVGWSENVTVSYNEVVDSGSYGIFVRGSENVTVSYNEVVGSYNDGIQVDASTAIVSFNAIKDNDGCGISMSGSSVEVISNSISLSKLRTTDNAFGIALYSGYVSGNISGSTANLIDNHIGNYGGAGVYVYVDEWYPNESPSTLTGSGNTVTVEGTESTLNNAYWDNSPSQTFNNQLLVESFGASGVSGQNYHDNVEAGAVVAGTIYRAEAVSGGKFSVSFPEQPNTDNIVMFVKDANNNAICINAAPGFDLNNLGAVPPSEEAMQKIREFVTRMYDLALGRTPDQAGFENWVTKLAAHEVTGAEAAYGFVFGPELSGKNLSNEQFVAILYELMLDREADAAGLADWTSKLDNNLYSRQGVYRGFAESQEFTNICADYSIERGMGLSPVEDPEPRDMNFGVTEFVSRLYLIALNRAELDAPGLNDWCGQLVDKKSTPAQIVFGVIFSDECKNRDLSNEEFVNTLYRTYFGRERNVAEGEGEDWLSNLNAGASRESIVDGFSGSQEFFNLVATFGL